MSRKSCYILPLLAVGFLAILVPYAIFGQETTATLNGRVTDPSGAAIPGVAVEVRNVETNQATPIKTDVLGNYAAPYLRPGTYSITAEAAGFKKFVQTGLILNVAQVATVDIKLDLGRLVKRWTSAHRRSCWKPPMPTGASSWTPPASMSCRSTAATHTCSPGWWPV